MAASIRSEEHTSELQSLRHLVCRLLLEKNRHNALRAQIAAHAPARGPGPHVAGEAAPDGARRAVAGLLRFRVTPSLQILFFFLNDGRPPETPLLPPQAPFRL